VLVAIMQHMAALTEGLEIAPPVIAGVMVEMRGSQEDLGREQRSIAGRIDRQARKSLPLPVAPDPVVFIPPATIAQVNYLAAMRTATMLTAPFRAARPKRIDPDICCQSIG